MLNKRLNAIAFIVLSAFLSLHTMTSDAFAAAPVLVKDINTNAAGSSPQSLANMNGTLFFSANTGTTGWELVKSDGTTTGTVLVKDINPGQASSSPVGFVELNGIIYFAAADGVNGRELWRTDGTEAGTMLVKDINTGAGSSNPGQLTMLGSFIYFTADDGTHGPELWKTDGSTPTLVKDINPGTASSNIQYLKVVGTLLYFWADDGTNGIQLWTSDGTTSGTLMVSALNVNPNSPFYDLSGKAVFSALDSYNVTTGHGVEPFVSDGTSAGTQRIEVTPGYKSGFFGSEFGILNSYAYFMGGDITYPNNQNLYRTDGSSASYFNGVGIPKSFLTIGTKMFFVGNDSTNGYQIWVTDGLTSTSMVKRIGLDLYQNGSKPPANLTNVNGTLYFTAYDDVTYGLWKSDGTAGNTVKVTTKVANPTNLTTVGTLLCFTANDGVNGQELWCTDGTDAGTYMLKVNTAGTAPAMVSGAVQMNGIYYFAADDGVHGTELWKSDGNDAGTLMVLDIVPGLTGSSVSNLTPVGNTLFFTACDVTNGCELWKSDGTAGGTAIVSDISPGAGSSSPANLTNLNGVLFFTAYEGTNGNELWKSDGTPAGTMMVKDIYSVPYYGSNPSYLTKVNGTLYFTADDGMNGNELWKSDGTSAGTVMVRDIYPGGPFYSSSPNNLININGTLFFTADDGVNGYELWKSDGTSGGTVLVKDINPSLYTGSNPSYLTNLNGILYFTADDGTNGIQLWKSNGTAAGTTRVTTVNPGLFNPELLTWVNGKLFFRANDGTAGVELWTSDGTTAGTVMVKDIFPGNNSYPYPDILVNVNGMLFFTADDGVHGSELWQSDGTAAGTTMVQDIYVDPFAGSNPNNLVNVQGTLFFFANDGQHGNELMTYQLTNSNPPTVVSSNPVPGATNVSPGTQIVAVFSEAMDPATINASTFTVSGIPGTVIYEGPNTATFIPSSLLSYGATYTVKITTGAHDVSGMALSSDATWTFITEYPVLKVTKKGSGSGMVMSNIGGITCGTTCSAGFNPGDVVILTAVPDAGITFIGWTGACTGTGSCIVTMNASKTVTATFSNPNWTFIETFDSLSLPAGWTVVSGFWDFNPLLSYYPNNTGGSGGYAYSNYWDWSELRSPNLDLSSMTAPFLEFKTDYYGSGGSGQAYVDVNVNGGESWITAWSSGTTDYPGPHTIQVDLSAIAAGKPAVVIRFMYSNGDSGSYWAIDDVKVYNNVDVTPPAIGMDITQTYKAQWGSDGSGDGQLSGPRGIAVDGSGNVYVADWGNNRIQKFNASGAYLTQWGGSGTGDGQFDRPYGVAVDSSGNVYATDIYNNRIQKFSSSGTYLTQWNSDGQLNGPRGIAVDASGNVYVADLNNNRIQKFNSNGAYLTQWGASGSGDGQFDSPTNLAVDVYGNVYVSDTYNSRIQKFSPNGIYLTQFGTYGSENGQLWNALGVAVDGKGNIYVSDTYNNRIQKFGPDGTYLTQWGAFGSGDDQFNNQNGIAVDSSFNVYVADLGNNRIQKFVPWAATSTTANGTYGVGSQINVTIAFTEPVSSSGLTINLNSGGSLATGLLESVMNWSGVYTVGAGENTPKLAVASVIGTITDSSGNSTVDPSVPAGLNIADNKSVTIDTAAPTVVASSPSPGAPSVQLNAAVTATFGEAMDLSTINGTTFLVSGATGSVTYDTGTFTATFTPSANLTFGTLYTATVTTGVKDLAGNIMAANYTWSFTTLVTTHTITASAGAHGTITPSGAIVVSDGGSRAFAVLPNPGYSVATVTVDLVSQGSITTYTFTNVTADHTISASFADITPPVGTITINGGTSYTNTMGVTLGLSCSDSGSGCSHVELSNFNNYSTSTIWSMATGTTVPWTLTAGDGPKNVYARYTDGDNNTSPSVTGSVTLDTSPPATTVSPPGGTYPANQNVTLTCTDALTPCSIVYSTGTSTITGSSTVNLLVTGSTTTLTYRAVDAAGNAEVVRTAVYIIDTNQPLVTLLTPTTNGYFNTAAVGYTLNRDMAVGQIFFVRTGGPADLSSHIYTMTGTDLLAGVHTVNTGFGNLVDGTVYTITVDVTDSAARNTTASSTGVTFDSTAAVLAITSPVSGGRVNTASVAYTLSENAMAGDIVIDDGITEPFVYSLTGSQLASGSHTVDTGFTNSLVDGTVYTFSLANVIDLAGNPTTAIAVPNVTFDKQAVVITNTSPVSMSIITTVRAGYTLSEQAASGTITFTRSGGNPDPASQHVYTMTVSDLTPSVPHTVTPSFTLVDGTFYTVSFAAMDVTGNPATTLSNALVFFDSTYDPVLQGNVDNTGPSANRVDNADVLKLEQALRTRPGDRKWNPVCDLDRNNVVDIDDLTILHSYYGQTGP